MCDMINYLSFKRTRLEELKLLSFSLFLILVSATCEIPQIMFYVKDLLYPKTSGETERGLKGSVCTGSGTL